MPNDTDFTVSRGAGVAGIDFAFAGERNHYHTRNDSAANLDPRSIQHHGDNVLPLVVSLAGGEPLVTGDTGDTGDTEESRLVYISAFGHLFLWPAAWSPVLLALAGVLLAFATWKSAAPPLQLLAAATLLPVLLLAAGGALVHASLAGLEALNGTTPAWPAQVGAFRARSCSPAHSASCGCLR